MNELFKKYIESEQFTNAVLAGKNLLNKNPGDAEVFTNYFELLCDLAMKLPILNERKFYLNQANVALAFYEENVDITEETMESLYSFKNRINLIANGISDDEKRQYDNYRKTLVDNNGKLIKELYRVIQKVEMAKSQNTLDEYLMKISEIDSNIERDYFTEDQKEAYDKLSRDSSNTISNKMREIERAENQKYNQAAIEAYSDAFQKFKDNEAKYKDQTQLFALVSSSLFAYDASKLFNETLIYYNHIYTYIFNKLDDSGKFALTKYSIECERKLR